MENGVTDRLWDKDVQEFIKACQHGKLSGIRLGYTVLDGGRSILNISATYRHRGSPVLVGYRWAERRGAGWLPEVFAGNHAVPPRLPGAVRRLAWKAGLWRDRKGFAAALEAVYEVFFKAQLVRTELDREHLTRFAEDGSPEPVARAQELTLQTLNDLAYLYSGSTEPPDQGIRRRRRG